MTVLLRILAAVALLAVAAFCVVGFMATFEPPGYPGWRIGYGAIGIACLVGAGVVLARVGGG